PNNMRSSSWGTGVYKSTDGGKTWSGAMLPKSQHIGRIVMDPSNPDVLYAASLQRERREYGFLPAGTETGIYKTTDGAKTWTQLKNGLPAGEMGRIGISVCKSRPNVVYAIVHAKAPGNGLYRSD